MKHRLILLMQLLFAAGTYGQSEEAEPMPDTPVIPLVLNCTPPYYPRIPLSTVFPEITMPSCLFVMDSTPYRRVDSLQQAIDSLCLLHQKQGMEKEQRYQNTLAGLQRKEQQMEAILAGYRKLFITALILSLSLAWMLFRVRRAAMRGKPLVLPHESAHEPTAGLS
jgi:hypothetical protein